jgi:hypothetical protein
MKQLLSFVFLVCLLTGCASRQRFGYQINTTPAGSVAGARPVEVLPVSDVRTNRAIDGSFTTNLLEDVRGIVGWELAGTDQFKPQTIPAPNPALHPAANAESASAPSPTHGGRGATQTSFWKVSASDSGSKTPPSTADGTPAATDDNRSPAELRLKTELKRLEWEVPNYNSIVANSFLLSLFTGGIGGGIYIGTSTTVNSFAVVQMELSEIQGGRVLLSQEYSGSHTEKMAKASCDTSTTKARMASHAFKDALTKWKVDLQRLPAGPVAEAKP